MRRHRRSIRLPDFDYSSEGAYFVTICTHQKEYLFGKIKNREMILNTMGKIIHEEWFKTQEIRSEIELDEFVIMPNHMHGIVWIRNVGAHGCVPRAHNHAPLRRPRSLSTWVAGFKWATTSRIRKSGLVYAVWQRNYYDRIIRNERELFAIRQYIRDNPLKWDEDPERT